MRIRTLLATTTVFALLVGFSTTAAAVEFEPFSDVEDVCPDCDKPEADVVTLAGGDEVRGEVVAENDDFYVMVRYREVRAIPHDDVDSIEWADGNEPSGLRDRDQIVLPSGHVFSGTIVEEEDEPPLFRIESSFADETHTVFMEEAETVYKDGSEYDFEIPEDDD